MCTSTVSISRTKHKEATKRKKKCFLTCLAYTCLLIYAIKANKKAIRSKKRNWLKVHEKRETQNLKKSHVKSQKDTQRDTRNRRKCKLILINTTSLRIVSLG